MASMTVNDYIDVGTGGVHVATSWQFAKDKEFTQIIDESIKDYRNVKKWHSKLPKRAEDKSSPEAEEYYTELDELWGRCKILVGETESDWFVVGPMSQRTQRVMVTDRTVENEEDPDGPKLTHEYMSNSTNLGWTDEIFEQDDPNILGPIFKEPEPEDEEEELLPEVEEQLPEEEEEGGDGLGGDPVLPDMEYQPIDPDEDNTVIIPEEEPKEEVVPPVEEQPEGESTEPLPEGQGTEQPTVPAPEEGTQPEVDVPSEDAEQPSQPETEVPSVPDEGVDTEQVLPEDQDTDPEDSSGELAPELPEEPTEKP